MVVKVSVLMPVYKTKEEYLRAAIDSILGQTFEDFELLIVDDCPSSPVDKIVKSYSDKRIKYSINEKNMGISDVRNKLVDMAKGEYLAIMDHDDISLPTRFEKQVKMLDENKNLGVVGTYSQSFPNNKTVKNPTSNEDIQIGMLVACNILHPTTMIRKAVLKENNIKYQSKYSPCEDYAIWCDLLEKTEFANIPEVLFNYRVHETNTSKLQKETLTDRTEIIRAIAKAKHPALWEIAKATGALEVTRIKLLGIPFFTVKKNYKSTKVYMFEFVPVMKIKTKYKRTKKQKYGV